MSFLLQGKQRRRSRGRQRVATMKGRVISKNASNSGSGQIEMQRPQVSSYKHQSTLASHQQQTNSRQDLSTKNEALQSAGISMEQVIEDIRVLEEQQIESQRKLKQARSLKETRTKKCSILENRLASLKYKNGERRTQLNRARDVLSKSTREVETIKLVASNDDDLLKEISHKLDKAMILSQSHQMHKCVVDVHIQNLRSNESVCHRYVSSLQDKTKKSSKIVSDIADDKDNIRQSINQIILRTKEMSEEISNVRAEASKIADELVSAKQMESTTESRVENIKIEIESDKEYHSKEIKAMKGKLESIRKKNATVSSERINLSKDVDEKINQFHEVWQDCVAIQKKEGFEISPEPTTVGPIPSIDLKHIMVTVQDKEGKISDETLRVNELTSEIDLQRGRIKEISTKSRCFKREIVNARKIYETLHGAEMKKTAQHEAFLATLEKEREETRLLHTSLVQLETTTKEELKIMVEKLSEQESKKRKEEINLENLKKVVQRSILDIGETASLLKIEEEKNKKVIKRHEYEAETSKQSFEKARNKVETLQKASNEKLERELNEIKIAQEIMIEDSKQQISNLMKGYSDLEDLVYKFDSNMTPEERITFPLRKLKQACQERKDTLRNKQKQILYEIRSIHEERQKILEREQQAEQRLAREARQREEEEKLRIEKERKEKRRFAREEKRRMRAELEAKREKKRKIEELEKSAAEQKKRRKSKLVKRGGRGKRIEVREETKSTVEGDKILDSPENAEPNHPKMELLASSGNDTALSKRVRKSRNTLIHAKNKAALLNKESGKEDKVGPYGTQNSKVEYLDKNSCKLNNNERKSKSSRQIHWEGLTKVSPHSYTASGEKELSPRPKIEDTSRDGEKKTDYASHHLEKITYSTSPTNNQKHEFSKNVDSRPKKSKQEIGTNSPESRLKGSLAEDFSRESLQVMYEKGNEPSIHRKKSTKIKSDKSIFSTKSNNTAGSQKSGSSSRKRSKKSTPGSNQTSGISSGERVSKSRRRKSLAPNSSKRTKARSSGILGEIGDDFNFNF